MPPQILPFDFGEEPINSGDMAIVNCAVVKGDYPLEIYWSLNGKKVEDMSGVSVLTNKRVKQLTIENVQGYHAGEYMCTVKNRAGSVHYSSTLNINGTYFSTLVS